MRLTTSQIVALEILVLLNLLACAVMLVIALAERWIDPARLSHDDPPAPIAAGAAASTGGTGVALPPNTLAPTHASPPTPPPPALTVSNTPTPLIVHTLQPAPIPTGTPQAITQSQVGSDDFSRSGQNATEVAATSGFRDVQTVVTAVVVSAKELAIPPPTAAPASVEEPKARLLKITGHSQTLPLSCEARSAADWAGYFGVAIEELDFFDRLPVSDNPETGFVGNVRSWWGQIPPNAYGVHAEPVAALLREYGLNALAVRGWSADEVKMEIANDRPLIAWVTGHVAPGKSVEYTTTDGQTVAVAPYEHTVIVIGYTVDQVMVLDGRKRYWRSWKLFLESWAVLGNMAVAAGQ
jgi:uncharacterized protein YvpB